MRCEVRRATCEVCRVPCVRCAVCAVCAVCRVCRVCGVWCLYLSRALGMKNAISWVLWERRWLSVLSYLGLAIQLRRHSLLGSLAAEVSLDLVEAQ